MSASVGDHYKNTSGTTLFGFFPPDAVCRVAAVGMEDNPAVGGSLVLELEQEEGAEIGRLAGLTDEDLARDWTAVRAASRKGGK